MEQGLPGCGTETSGSGGAVQAGRPGGPGLDVCIPWRSTGHERLSGASQRQARGGIRLGAGKSRGEWETVRTALHEFAVHGVRYAFPAVIGPPKRGIPTAFGVPPLSTAIASAPGDAPVWPSAQGTAKGPSLSPLSTGVPSAALADPALHQLLALQDALRSGRARERTLAASYLKQLLRLGDAL